MKHFNDKSLDKEGSNATFTCPINKWFRHSCNVDIMYTDGH